MRKLTILLLFLSLRSFGQTLESDRQALVAIYNQANGPSWLVNWVVPGNVGDSPCGWDGVTCAGGRVTRLSISNTSEPAMLPSEIGNLTELTHLDLSTDYLGPGFGGNLPSEIGNLSKLEYLNFLGNGFSSSSMSEIGSLTTLKELHITPSGDIPASFANLVNLERCVMGRFGPLEGINTIAFPDVVCQWPKIKMLRMGGVVFSTPIPSQIGNLTTLDTLELTGTRPYPLGSYSSVGGLPAEIGNLTNLRCLNISYNGLTGGIPASFNNLTNLTTLDLSYNSLSDPIPNLLGVPVAADVRINNNNFNYRGMESNISRLDQYSPQALINAALIGPMCVGCLPTWIMPYTGGTMANLTHKLYKGDVLHTTVSGIDGVDLDGEGIYRVETTNSLVPNLTLVTKNYVVVKLPVTLVSFDGRSENNQTKLVWKTTSETNNKGFEIERSADARTFEKIGFVDGSGNTKDNQHYHFTDLAPFAISYYRLKQFDYDGKFEYSKVITVKSDAAIVKVYPNPAQDYLTVSGISQKQPFSIVDGNGRVVIEGQVTNMQQINIRNFVNGRYVVRVGEVSSSLLIHR
ncbi:T9SS type A sorting domain-containing protein [Dyadobacter jiangsuensis]|uniref:Putative secreted protein (Por secretion system target) n=1 Tax=Dyadobacter jiangsuensis TaxID=1591085 RepID=A0A2P8FTV9_9BACT|nr:T9SS type A sorting domain-containing protein [Dyadobacter jiangsuensis]PSL25141.1 putative secreted protein (Por secretion system target) [Dyadobacter jiangsuensis]